MKKARDGDVDAQHKIVLQYRHFVEHLAGKYKARNLKRLSYKESILTHEDLVGAGIIGLYKAISNYKDAWDINTTISYIKRIVKNHINVHIISFNRKSDYASGRYYQMKKYELELKTSHNADDFYKKVNLPKVKARNLYELYQIESKANETHSEDYYNISYEYNYLNKIIQDELSNKVQKMILNNEVLKLKYKDGLSLREIGKQYNKNHKTILNTLQKIESSIKEELRLYFDY